MSRKKSKDPTESAAVTFRRLTPGRMEDLREVLRGSWGSGCWCMHPRLTASKERELPGGGSISERRRTAMIGLARRKRAPGLVAYEGERAVGWIAVGPRKEYLRVESSRATPRVDDAAVWLIPCLTVRTGERGRGIAVALIRAAVDFAAEHGAPAVEAHPRADAARTKDDSVYYGTEPLFRRAGFRVVRPPIPGQPKGWAPRVAMRIDCE